MSELATRHVHPLTAEEHGQVVLAVKVLMDVLPPGDDERGETRAVLESALDKLERHWCPWCPNECRDLYAQAYNVVVNQGSGRLAKKLASLASSLPFRTRDVEQHFRETNEWHAKQPDCAWLDGCRIGPGGRWHDPDCPVEKARRPVVGNVEDVLAKPGSPAPHELYAETGGGQAYIDAMIEHGYVVKKDATS